MTINSSNNKNLRSFNYRKCIFCVCLIFKRAKKQTLNIREINYRFEMVVRLSCLGCVFFFLNIYLSEKKLSR